MVAQVMSPRGFVPLPNAILLSPSLSRGARLLWGVLKRHARQRSSCWPGYRSLCRDLAACEDTVRRWMRELIALGLVRQQRRGQGRTNIYTLIMPDSTAVQDEPSNPEPEFCGVLEPEGCRVEVEKKGEEERGGAVDISTALPTNYSDENRPDPIREALLPFVRDFRRELNDRAPITATTTRAVNTFHRAGVEFSVFVDALYTARVVTRERTASIRDRDDRGARKTPYFFAILEDRLGLRDGPLRIK